MRSFVISLIVWSVCQPLLSAGERLTPERLWQLARLGSVCLSPDGNTVAYAVRRYNLPENQGRSEIHVLDLADPAGSPVDRRPEERRLAAVRHDPSGPTSAVRRGARRRAVPGGDAASLVDRPPRCRSAASDFGRRRCRQSEGVADLDAHCLHVRSETGHRPSTNCTRICPRPMLGSSIRCCIATGTRGTTTPSATCTWHR